MQLFGHCADSEPSKYFWRHDSGHESTCSNNQYNGDTKYRICGHSCADKPRFVLFARRRNWLLHIEWKHFSNHLCVLKNRCIRCAIFGRKGQLAREPPMTNSLIRAELTSGTAALLLSHAPCLDAYRGWPSSDASWLFSSWSSST